MYTKSEMQMMSNEELNIIAQKKNKRGIAVPEAKYAQELIWERRFYSCNRFEDDYEGWIDPYDEGYQEYLDYVEFMDCLN